MIYYIFWAKENETKIIFENSVYYRGKTKRKMVGYLEAGSAGAFGCS
jgi:hypothetical protein